MAAPAPFRLGLYLGVAPHAGGLFQYAQSVAEALAALDPQRYAVTFACGNAHWPPILERLGLRGQPLRHARLGARLADAAMALRLPPVPSRLVARLVNPVARQLLALRCDAWLFPAQESLSYQLPAPTIGAIHDLMHRYQRSFPEVGGWLRYGAREHRFRSIAASCQAVLVDSEVGRQQVMESYGVAAARLFPVPYVAPSYLATSAVRADFDAHYRLPPRFLFYPAQFWPHKNHRRLLDALKLVSVRHPDVALVLTGAERHAFEEVRAHAKAIGLAGRVHFKGYVPDQDLKGFYQRARALVMPTFFGPTNVPPLEAMSLGCPVVVSGLYGMREQCGDAALYVDPTSVSDMAARIAEVWGDDALAATLARKGLERAALDGQQRFNRQLLQVVEAVRAAAPSPAGR